MFTVSQIRTIQGALIQLNSVAARDALRTETALQKEVRRSNDALTGLRLVTARTSQFGEAQGVLFRYRSDPVHLSHLILADNRGPTTALDLKLPEKENRPTLLDLHYANTQRRAEGTAHYFFFGALTVHNDPEFNYTLLKRKDAHMETLAVLLYALNLRVEDLPYPDGRKLSTLDAFKKLGIRYVGELVQRDVHELQDVLDAMEWITIKSILKNLNLVPGTHIPQWRPPR